MSEAGRSAAPTSLTGESLARGLRWLSRRDPDLAGVLARLGPPPMWRREAGFQTLVQIILEQQVSLASARAVYDRLVASAAPLTAGRILQLSDAELRAFGFSRQKATYVRGLAQTIADGRLDLAALGAMSDADVRSMLTGVRGIGNWTADIYLLMALGRADVWPTGDLALAVAAQRLKRLARRPTPDELEAIARAWRPWRAVAARLLWHYYLSAAGRKT